MNQINPLERIWVWCKRFHHRSGYGVHSPFAFNLLTWVIYEGSPFYAYKRLEKIRCRLHREGYETLGASKVNKLLFRLVNHLQPKTVLEFGTQTGLQMLAMSIAKSDMRCVTLDARNDINFVAEELLKRYCKNVDFIVGDISSNLSQLQESFSQFDFVHFNQYVACDRILELCMRKVVSSSVFVVEGIHYSPEMLRWWEKIIEDDRTGITFDLYYVGLIFFDQSKIKQHYIVNF